MTEFMSKQLHQLKITKRFVMYVGWRCNLRCQFCYYLKELETGKTNDRSTEEIKKILFKSRKRGKTSVDFSGGEPTIRKDFSELISYAKDIGYKTICVITNGICVSDKSLLKEYVDAGLNDILFSLHSHDPGIHDNLVCRKGAHEKLLASIGNAKDLGLTTRINQVVNGLNYMFLEKSAQLANSFEPDAFNLILLNQTVVNRQNRDILITYSELVPYLQKVIDRFGNKFKTLNIRNIPFCLLKGYEKHNKTMWQRQYESVEWDYTIDRLYRMSRLKTYIEIAIGMLIMVKNPRFYQTKWNVKLCDAMQQFRISLVRKQLSVCNKCTLRYICPGISKLYLKDHDGRELEPYLEHEAIIDPTYFMEDREKEN